MSEQGSGGSKGEVRRKWEDAAGVRVKRVCISCVYILIYFTVADCRVLYDAFSP